MLLYDALLPYKDQIKSIRKKLRKADIESGDYRKPLKKAYKEISMVEAEIADFEKHIKIALYYTDDAVMESTKKWITDPNTWFEGERIDAVQSLLNRETRDGVEHELNCKKLYVKEQLALTCRQLLNTQFFVEQTLAAPNAEEAGMSLQNAAEAVKAAHKAIKGLCKYVRASEPEPAEATDDEDDADIADLNE